MKYLFAAIAAFLATTVLAEAAKAGDCRYAGQAQAVQVVQAAPVVTYQAVPVQAVQFQAVQMHYAVPAQNLQFVQQRQLYGNSGFQSQRGFSQQRASNGGGRQRAFGGGGGGALDRILSPEVLFPAVGAAAGAAIFPGAAPLGAGAGSVLGSILSGR